jgi:hypothetical protein
MRGYLVPPDKLPAMGFASALTWMSEGSKVRRRSWRPELYISRERGDIVMQSFVNGTYSSTAMLQVPVDDILARDWEIIK